MAKAGSELPAFTLLSAGRPRQRLIIGVGGAGQADDPHGVK